MRFTGIRSPCSHTNPPSSARSATDVRRPLARASCDRALRLQPPISSRITLGTRAYPCLSDGRGKSCRDDRGPTFRGNSDVGGKSRRRSRERKPTLGGSGTDGRGNSTTSRPLQNRNLPAARSSSEGFSRIPQTTVPTEARGSSVVVGASDGRRLARPPGNGPLFRLGLHGGRLRGFAPCFGFPLLGDQGLALLEVGVAPV